jgi:hypothetical protein
LLEDIDTAGVIREPTDTDEKDATSAASDPAGNEWNVLNLTKALKKANQLSEEEKRKESPSPASSTLLMVSRLSPSHLIPILSKTKYLTNPKG